MQIFNIWGLDGIGKGGFVVKYNQRVHQLERLEKQKKRCGPCALSFRWEIWTETICKTGPLPFKLKQKNLIHEDSTSIASSVAWIDQGNRNNQHLKELVNFNRFDSRIPGPNSSKDLNCHRCHELTWNLQHLSIFYSWKPSITSIKRIICTCGAIGAPGDRCGELTPQITSANEKKKQSVFVFRIWSAF